MINHTTGLITVIFVFVSFIFSIYKWLKRKKKRISILAMKIKLLLKEVREGLDIMKNELKTPLPEKRWKGEENITKEDMYIILAVSKSEKNKTKEFSPSDIKGRCENYYENITQDWKKIVEFPIERKWEKILEECKNTGKWQKIQKNIEETEKIIKMLEHIKSSLDYNSKRWFPK
jgi:hypothetical protein